MLDLTTLEGVIRTSPFFKRNSPGVIHGFYRSYFPRFQGFSGELLSKEELATLAVEFYKSFYWYKLKLDQIEDHKVATMLLYFSSMEGSKKALQKTNKTIGLIYGTSGYQGFSSDLVVALNSSSEVYKTLMIELLEFYSYTGRHRDSEWIFEVYRIHL